MPFACFGRRKNVFFFVLSPVYFWSDSLIFLSCFVLVASVRPGGSISCIRFLAEHNFGSATKVPPASGLLELLRMTTAP